MFTYPTNQFPYKDESASNASTANTCGDTSLYGSLRKELAMANLIKRREVWYARVRWTDKNHREVEKQILPEKKNASNQKEGQNGPEGAAWFK